MNFLKPLSASEKIQRKGVFLLLLVIVVIQLLYWKSAELKKTELVSIIDFKMDSTIKVRIQEKKSKLLLQPFNANYMTEYRAYVLGLSSEELHRLETFRASNNYLYSLEDFQNISGVDDTLMVFLKPYLKFSKKKDDSIDNVTQLKLKNINTATDENLKEIYGIGDVLSKRIVAYRKSINGFKSMDDLYNVYGLDSLVVARVKSFYKIYE